MCGIAGVLDAGGGASGEELLGQARRMADSLAHRGPDDAGAWSDPAAGIALGHRRLSILDLSAAGHQPMHSRCGRYTVTYNGEIYNFLELRDRLERCGVPFRGHCDTEVLLAALGEWGLGETLAQVNGMFAFGLWDHAARSLHLVRDRLGEKPLYYGWAGRRLLFASELKALRAEPGLATEIDRAALALLLRFSYVPSPHTIYRGVFKLPPGCVLTVTPARPGAPPEPAPYWSVLEVAERGTADPLALTPDEARDSLDGLLRDAVRMRMHADVPLGAFLSGGIDSSTVVAMMQAQSDRPVRTFTVGFAEAEVDEADHARAVARHLGTDHTEARVSPAEALDVIPRLPAIYDEPFADPSQIPMALIAAVARRHVTVSLSGDGGDEVFGGYNRYALSAYAWRRLARAPRFLRVVAANAVLGTPPGAVDALARRLEPVVPAPLRVRAPGAKLHKLADMARVAHPDELYLALVSHWSDPAAVVVGTSEPPTVATDRTRWPRVAGTTERMMALDSAMGLPEDMLTKVDRSSMRVGLETRVPLLDHRVVELAWRLPLDLKIRDDRGKWLLRRVLDRYVPASLVERPKTGFDPPIGTWLRGPLRDWAESLLAPRRLAEQGLLDPAPVAAVWNEHVKGRRNHDYRLWTVLMFQAWLDAA